MSAEDMGTGAATEGAGRPWTDAESDAAFEALGDKVIDATRRFMRSNRRLRIQSRLYTVHGHEFSRTQIAALEVIDREDGVRMSHLAARLGLDPSTVTRTINPLVKLGLVERYNDPENRRSVVVRCTTDGADSIARVVEARRRVMRETLSPMEPSRRLLLAELLDEYTTLIEGLPDSDDDPAGRH